MRRRPLSPIALGIVVVALAGGIAFAQSSAAPAGQAPATASSDRQVHAFGNWVIRQDHVTQGYSLTGRATGREPGELWLRCEKNGMMLVGVPMPGKGTNDDRPKTQQITIRADDAPSREMTFLVFEGFVALAMDAEGLQNDRVAAFIDQLQKAKRSVVVSYNKTNLELDVSEFGAARARFSQLCTPRPVR